MRPLVVTNKNVKAPAPHRGMFAVGFLFSAVVLFLVVWGFSLGELSEHRRWILSNLLPPAVGFMAGSFTGTFTFKSRGFWPGALMTATGGFGVWLLLTYILAHPLSPVDSTAQAQAFTVVIKPTGPAGPLDVMESGSVRIGVGTDIREVSIDSNGLARFPDIPGEFTGNGVSVDVKAPGHHMVNPEQEVLLAAGSIMRVKMEIDPDSPASTKNPVEDVVEPLRPKCTVFLLDGSETKYDAVVMNMEVIRKALTAQDGFTARKIRVTKQPLDGDFDVGMLGNETPTVVVQHQGAGKQGRSEQDQNQDVIERVRQINAAAQDAHRSPPFHIVYSRSKLVTSIKMPPSAINENELVLVPNSQSAQFLRESVAPMAFEQLNNRGCLE